MRIVRSRSALLLLPCVLFLLGPTHIKAAELTVELGDLPGVTLVGALRRWDQDGNPRRPVDEKAKINAPHVDAKASDAGGGRWVFRDLPSGKYDLLIMARDPATKGPLRIEGWHYAPVLEFDPFFPPTATSNEKTRKLITDQISRSRHYENKVVLLHMGGDKQAVRVLMMLIRDQPTSYKPGLGSIRHEIWQYTYRYGGWQKEKRTRVLDRILLPVKELRRWRWLWDARLGGIELQNRPMTINYRLPNKADKKRLQGLYPY